MHRIRFFVHSLAHLINDSYGGFLAPLLPLLAAKYNLSLAEAGLLASIQTLAASLSQPFWAWLSDRNPSKWFILGGVTTAGVFFSLMGVAPNVFLLGLTVFAGGLGIACFHPMATALASNMSTNRKGLAIAFFITAGTAGYAVGPVFVSTLVAYGGLSLMPLAVIPGIIIVIVWNFLGPKKFSNVQIKKSETDVGEVQTRIPYKAITLLTTTSVIRAFVLMTFANFMSFYLIDFGLDLQTRSYYLFALQFGGAMGGLFYGGLSDKFGRWRVMFWSPLLSLPFLYMFLSTQGVVSFIMLFLAGSLVFASAPAVVVAAQKMMPGREGMASALQIGFAWGMGGVSMGLVGKAGEMFGVLNVLYVTAVLPLVISILTLSLRGYRHQFEDNQSSLEQTII